MTLLFLAACANLSKSPDSGLDTGDPLAGAWSGTVAGQVSFSEWSAAADYCSGQVEGQVFSSGLLRAVGTCEIGQGQYAGVSSYVFIEGMTDEPMELQVEVPFEGGERRFDVEALRGVASDSVITAAGNGAYVSTDGDRYPARLELSLAR
jgi:hypothetical protein